MQVKGRVSQRQERLQLICKWVSEYQVPVDLPPVQDELSANGKRLVISMSETEQTDDDVAKLRQIIDLLKAYPGSHEVRLSVATEEGTKLVRLDIKTDYCPALRQRLVELVGAEGVRVE